MTSHANHKKELNLPVFIVFDFDWSLVNENSDTWIIQQLCPDLMEYLGGICANNQWTKLMDHIVREKMMLERGITLHEIDRCLESIPVFPEVVDAIKLAHENGAKLAILSDANVHYIDVILKHLKLDGYFTDIVTNQARTMSVKLEDGQIQKQVLHISPYQSEDSPHSCPLCPPNLCKGGVLEEWRKRLEQTASKSTAMRVIYVGDGGGDFCPCQRCLHAQDTVLCRQNWALHKRIKVARPGLAAQTVPWSSGSDILREITSALFTDKD